MSFHFRYAPQVSAGVTRYDAIEAIIFDVEGTLVDSVLPTLCSWQDVLCDYGHCFTTGELHRTYGLPPRDMLAMLLPTAVPNDVRKAMASTQREVYAAKYLHRVQAFRGARRLLAQIHARGMRVALTTPADPSTLCRYLALLEIGQGGIDAIVCGSGSSKSLLQRAVERLSSPPSKQMIAIGASPFDAQIAVQLGIGAVGVLTGHFSRAELDAAGCSEILENAMSLFEIGSLARLRARGSGCHQAPKTRRDGAQKAVDGLAFIARQPTQRSLDT
jgi:phosphoglycolate phosphatase-like HAD superfamily hydrolase